MPWKALIVVVAVAWAQVGGAAPLRGYDAATPRRAPAYRGH
jgi:hypothetical protein